MPHLRKRYAQALVQKLARFSPLVGVLGHRQVGKTTLLQEISGDYRTFDRVSERKAASDDPEAYVNSLKAHHTVIDESQLVPELFPTLKEHVRKHKKPGQFFLSGSVRFTSRKILRESLTGRIQYLELLPMSISEIEGEPLPAVASQLLESRSLEQFAAQLSHSAKHSKARRPLVQLYLERGGLPGVCFVREEKLRVNRIQDQLQTILDRDIRQIYPTTLAYEQMLDFVRVLAATQGSPLRFEELKRQIEIAPLTQKKLLYALEATFMIRRLPIEGGRKGFVVVLEDQAESHYLAGTAVARSAQLWQLLYRNLRTEFNYRLEKQVEFFQYRSMGGVVIPLALRHQGATLGFVPIAAARPSRAEILSAQSFLKTYLNSKVVFFHEQSAVEPINARMISLPIDVLV